MRPTKRQQVLRDVTLLLVSMVLVMGFWVHREFYQIGLGPLVVIGGVATYVVIKLLFWSSGAVALRYRPLTGTLLFDPEEVEGVLARRQTAIIRPLRRSHLVPGTLVGARSTLGPGSRFAVLEIVEIERLALDQIPTTVLRLTGSSDVASLPQRLADRYRVYANTPLRVIHFRLEEVRG